MTINHHNGNTGRHVIEGRVREMKGEMDGGSGGWSTTGEKIIMFAFHALKK